MSHSIIFKSIDLTLHGSLFLPSNYSTGILFLHGGGQSNASRYLSLQQQFVKQSIASLAIDFRGCGQSDGAFEEGSLANRLLDAEAALALFLRRSKLQISHIYLWGSSMGGHVACRLADKHPDLKGLVLQSAAAYASAAESLPLNDRFTQAIRIPNSWTGSPAFGALANYPGKILVVYGEKDTLIPDGIKNRYREIAESAGEQYFTLHGGAHALLHPQTDADKQVLGQLTNLALNFITGS